MVLFHQKEMFSFHQIVKLHNTYSSIYNAFVHFIFPIYVKGNEYAEEILKNGNANLSSYAASQMETILQMTLPKLLNIFLEIVFQGQCITCIYIYIYIYIAYTRDSVDF